MNSIARVVLISNGVGKRKAREREWVMVSWSSKPLRITMSCRIRALAPSELDVRASGIAIRLRPHGGIGFHVTAAMGPEKKIKIKSESGPAPGQPMGDRTLTMLISNLTESVFRLTLSNTSGSATSPVGGGDTCCCWCCCCCGVAAAISCGIGGRFLLLAGECERLGESSAWSVAEASSGWTVGALDETLKNEDEPLLCVAPNVGPGTAPPEGRPGSSLSFSLCVLPFKLVSPVRSLSLSLSLRVMPKESFDALRTIRLVVPPESPDPADPCLRCFLGDGVGVPCGSCSDEMSIEGRCMQSNPVLVSLYCTCIRSSTRRMSALSTAGALVDVVATL